MAISLLKEKDTPFLDVGCGSAGITLALAQLGFSNLTAIDCSKNALDAMASQMKEKGLTGKIRLLNCDILDSEGEKYIENTFIWHDRFTFHFFVKEDEVRAYSELAKRKVLPNGFVILTTYSPEGPDTCSGLKVMRYDHFQLQSVFRNGFDLVQYRYGDHIAPTGAKKPYVTVILKKTSS
ncbi:MAG: class I SAM-dependent methyltransferase [Thermoplasmataceae archaeon]